MARTPIWQRKGLLSLSVSEPGVNMWSWSDVGWYVAVFMGIWGTLMGTGDYTLADVFFGLAAALFLGKLSHATHIHRPPRKIALFVTGLLVTMIVVTCAFYWTTHKAAEAKEQKNQLAQLQVLLSKKARLTFLVDPISPPLQDGSVAISFAVQNVSEVASGRGFFNVVLCTGCAFLEVPSTFQNLSGRPDDPLRSSYFDYIGAFIHTAPIKMRVRVPNAGGDIMSFFYSCENCSSDSWKVTTPFMIPRRSSR